MVFEPDDRSGLESFLRYITIIFAMFVGTIILVIIIGIFAAVFFSDRNENFVKDDVDSSVAIERQRK